VRSGASATSLDQLIKEKSLMSHGNQVCRFLLAGLCVVASSGWVSGQNGTVTGSAVDLYRKGIGAKECGIKGVEVAVHLGGKDYETVTGAKGQYRLSGLPGGVVNVEFRHGGYIDFPTIVKNVSVNPTAPVTAIGELTPKEVKSVYIAAFAGSIIEVAQASPLGKQQSYRHQWIQLYQARFPVLKKPALVRAIRDQHADILDAVPVCQQYLNADLNTLKTLDEETTKCFDNGNVEGILGLQGVQSLPPDVVVDLVTEIATRSPEARSLTTSEDFKKFVIKVVPQKAELTEHLVDLRTGRMTTHEFGTKAIEFENPKKSEDFLKANNQDPAKASNP
jgi:hypothetical protein